jgi:uncharacterized membrane protein (TIGR02234 family)
MISQASGRSGGLRANRGSARREVVVVLVLGAAGAGLVFLASRQGWAQVRTVPPKPLPASQVTVTGSALVPYADALALAGLATLAAVLATRGLARRVTGLLLALLGASVAASAFAINSAAAISAASSNVGPATAGAGSVVDGNGSAPGAVPNVAGTAPHVTFGAGGWQALVVVGSLAMVGAGVLVVWRADRMAVMSARYEPPTAGVRRFGPASRSGSGLRPGADGAAAPDSASIWDALSRGDDPTAVDTGPQKA